MANIVRFDCFEVDLDAGLLRKHGTRIRLRDQSFRVLASLLEHAGRVVSRDELRQQLWHDDVFVNFDNNLNILVARLREALGDSAEHPRYIETLPKRGYRFLRSVCDAEQVIPASAPCLKIVVLPFLNLTGDPGQEYLADAVTEELITTLAGLAPDALGVIARTTAMQYKNSRKDVLRIGSELHADHVVEGGVRRDSEEIILTVQLVQTRNQTHLFAKRYAAPNAQELFCLQNRIATEILAHIPGVPEHIRVADLPNRTANLEAYDEYVRGRYQMLKAASVHFSKAKEHLERSIALDPQFALAHDAMAELHWYLAYFGFMPARDAFSTGILHALRALEINSMRAETHALLGQFHKAVDYDWPEVHREMALARKLDRNSPLVRMRYAVSELMPHGRIDEAVTELERALELDPLSFFTRMWLGIMLILCRRYDRAILEARRILDDDPEYFLAYFLLAVCYRYQNLKDEAIAAQRRCVELSGNAALMLGWLGLTLAVSGEQHEARDVLKGLQNLSEQQYVPPTSFAWIHLGLGNVDAAFEWLNRAVQECDQMIMPIKSYAFFDPIRTDPRFTSLLRKMKLEA